MSGTGNCPAFQVESWLQEIDESEAALDADIIPYGLALHLTELGSAMQQLLHLIDYAAACDHLPTNVEIMDATRGLRKVLDDIDRSTLNHPPIQAEINRVQRLMGDLTEIQEVLHDRLKALEAERGPR